MRGERTDQSDQEKLRFLVWINGDNQRVMNNVFDGVMNAKIPTQIIDHHTEAAGLRRWVGVLAVAALIATGPPAESQTAKSALTEAYVHDALPPGFQVVVTEMDGPLFADADGHTLYRWPVKGLRNGLAGEQKGKPTCDDTRYRESSGLMSPYPPGLELPEVDSRPSCAQLWPPVLAAADAKPVARWSIVERKDGREQWAYDGNALYTSVLDHALGDVIGGDRLRSKGDAPAVRFPVGPPPDVPAQFLVAQTTTGRLLTIVGGASVYAWDKDGPNKSNCDAICLRSWEPVLAAEAATNRGEWSVIERAPGIKQWAFRKKPLYTHIGEDKPRSFQGSDVPGWHNVYTQAAPPPPKGFTVQDTPSGQVLADAHGMTIYVYKCGDDAIDQLACDLPDTPQEYRLAVCGGGDADRCLQAFPYVIADKDARSDSRIWSMMDIDPKTGHRARPDQPGALHVWAYRQRPVYTFFRDRAPGQIGADAWGEFNGYRNGYHAFWLRDDFRDGNE